MNNQLSWYKISLEDQDSFGEFLNLFKVYLEQVQERNGNNAIYFPTKSFPNDYSKVFLSISKEENISFKELLTKYNATELEENPSEEISVVYSDKDAPFPDDEKVSFI